MIKKPANLIYGVDDKPSFLSLILLGFQHIFIISIAFIFPIVIINEIGGSPEDAENLVCTAMIATGVATILQALNKGFVGSGYLCPLVNGPAFVSASLLAAKTGGLSLIFGMTFICGIFEGLFSRVIAKMRSVFPAEVTGTVVVMVGIEVIPIAMPKFFGVDKLHPSPDLTAISAALITLIAMASFNVWGKGKLRLYSVLIGMAIGYIYSFIVGVLTVEHLKQLMNTKFFTAPAFFKYGMTFKAAMIIPFVVAMLSSALKTMGDLTTCQKINDANWKRPDMKSISKGVLACSFGNIFSGLIGAVGQSVSSSNIGLSIATGATSRRIGYAIGGLLIILAFCPKLASIFVIMPTPIMGATLVFAVSFMILAGIQIMMSRMIDARKTFVIGFSIIFGLSVDFAPALYKDAPYWIKPLFSSSLSLATVSAVFLNLFFRIGISKNKIFDLHTGEDSSEKVFEIMEKQGGAWGARKEPILNAAISISEFMELANYIELKNPLINVEIKFDEFNLEAYIKYHGKPFEISKTRPTKEEIQKDEEADIKLSAYVLGKHADKIEFHEKDDHTTLHLHFEH